MKAESKADAVYGKERKCKAVFAHWPQSDSKSSIYRDRDLLKSGRRFYKGSTTFNPFISLDVPAVKVLLC